MGIGSPVTMAARRHQRSQWQEYCSGVGGMQNIPGSRRSQKGPYRPIGEKKIRQVETQNVVKLCHSCCAILGSG